MFNSNNGYSLSDVAAVTKESDGFMGNGAWWIIILFLFMFSNGNLFGGGNGASTRSELDFTNLDSSIRGVQQGLADGFYAVNTGMLNGFNGIQRDLCAGFGGVNAAITSLGYQMKDMLCLDGGGSTTVVLKEDQGRFAVVNDPCGSATPGDDPAANARAVADAILILGK